MIQENELRIGDRTIIFPILAMIVVMDFAMCHLSGRIDDLQAAHLRDSARIDYMSKLIVTTRGATLTTDTDIFEAGRLKTTHFKKLKK